MASFSLFPRLPTLARDLIWEYACNFPRNIIVAIKPHPVACKKKNPPHSCPIVFYSGSRNPGVLTACKESQKIALNHYQLSFRTIYLYFPEYNTPPRIWVNFKVDRVCLEDSKARINNTLLLNQGGIDNCTSQFVAQCLYGQPQKPSIRYIGFNLLKISPSRINRILDSLPDVEEVAIYGAHKLLDFKGELKFETWVEFEAWYARGAKVLDFRLAMERRRLFRYYDAVRCEVRSQSDPNLRWRHDIPFLMAMNE